MIVLHTKKIGLKTENNITTIHNNEKYSFFFGKDNGSMSCSLEKKFAPSNSFLFHMLPTRI